MQDTDTKITVSSINDINSFNLERIITVKGGIENMARAEAFISAKLRQSYENDLQVRIVYFFYIDNNLVFKTILFGRYYK